MLCLRDQKIFITFTYAKDGWEWKYVGFSGKIEIPEY